MRRRIRVWSSANEHRARRVMRWLIGGVVVAGIIVGVVQPIAQSYEANTCDYAWEPGQRIRNSIVYPETRPTCQDGNWTVTTPRDQMPEDAYGFNCFRDGNGTCGPRLEWLDASCLTDPEDGYTMCQDGSVYYRENNGAKLWPVERNPT